MRTMIDPHVEHGGASSWFLIAANDDIVRELMAPVADAPAAAATSSGSCSGVVTDLLAVVDAGAELRLRRQELRRHPPEDVVDDRLGEADVGVLRHARRLEADVAELVDQVLQRHAVLQRVADRLRERVGKAGDGRAFLRHDEEDLAGRPVLEEARR